MTASIPIAHVESEFRAEMTRLFRLLDGVWTIENDSARSYILTDVAGAALSLRFVAGGLVCGRPLYYEAIEFARWAHEASCGVHSWRSEQDRRAA